VTTAPTEAPTATSAASETGTDDRFSKRPVDKFGDRRAELANSALQTLGELGYARTSLREIAQNSQFTHGLLHYYFRDKIELITHSVRQYKAECVTRYDDIVAQATTADQLRDGIGVAMARTLVDDAPLHRLWYDLRTQSFFEDSLRADVLEMDAGLEAMIWRVVTRYCELTDARPAMSSAVAYALFDGLFQQALLHLTAGADPAPVPGQLKDDVMALLAGIAEPVRR
jgi:AcrR family transcriptional regulator